MNVREIEAKPLLSSARQPDPWFGIKYTMNLVPGLPAPMVVLDAIRTSPSAVSTQRGLKQRTYGINNRMNADRETTELAAWGLPLDEIER